MLRTRLRNVRSRVIKVIEENSDDCRAFWKTVKKILPGESRKMSTSMKIGNDISNDRKIIANAFNDHFAGAISRLVCDTGNSVINTGRNLMSRAAAIVRANTQEEIRPPFHFNEVTVSSVLAQLRRLKVGKASGLDNIPVRLLKDSAIIIAKHLARIINASLQQGKVPSAWKCARVIPLFKKGSALNMDNYRPISVLPVISKPLEREVHNQLTKYLREHKILSPYQYGFRKLHSTEFATLAFADTIRRNIDNGLMTGAVFLDFKKAFDSVDHSLLLDKLYNLGILDREHEWFANYLNGRKQIVDYHGMLSATMSVDVGVPQGSILGPFLFVLHVNDLPNATCHCSVLMYADDTVLFCSGRDAYAIENKLNNEMSLLGTWLRDNRLFLNTVKTESMLIGTQAKVSKVINFNIMWNGILIK